MDYKASSQIKLVTCITYTASKRANPALDSKKCTNERENVCYPHERTPRAQLLLVLERGRGKYAYFC